MGTYFLSKEFFASLASIAAGIALLVFVGRLAERIIRRRSINGRHALNIHFVVTIVRYMLAVMTGLFVLQINGINVSSLVAGLGVVGIIVGYALQDILKDIAMGSNITMNGFFTVGDVVRYGDIEGEVISFNARVTKLRNINTGGLMTISNRNISEIEILADWQDIYVPAPYDIPAERMRTVSEEIADRISGLPDVSECRFLGTQAFEDSDILYCVRVFSPRNRKPQMRRDALSAVQDVLAENKIEIPFPQLDIHNK